MEIAAPENAKVVKGKKKFQERGKECGKTNFEKTIG